MRRLLAFALIMGLAVAVNGQMLSEGTQEIFGSFSLDPEGPAGNTDWGLDAGYGYFVMDNVEVGGLLGLSESETLGQKTTAYRIGPFGEYNWPIEGTMWVPAIGLSASWYDAEFESFTEAANPTGSGLEVALRPAIKFYVSDPVSIDFGVPLRWASDDVYINDAEADDTDWGIDARIRAAF